MSCITRWFLNLHGPWKDSKAVVTSKSFASHLRSQGTSPANFDQSHFADRFVKLSTVDTVGPFGFNFLQAFSFDMDIPAMLAISAVWKVSADNTH